MTIETRIESARGCGYRKPGGIYIVGPIPALSCGRLPVPLTVCPCCHAGIKPSRGWTWISGELLNTTFCSKDKECWDCNWLKPGHKYGLIWIGEAFYRNPAAFIAEAAMAGISRRLSAIPRDFIVGITTVALAHRKAIVKYDDKGNATFTPAVFTIFKPTAIEYIVRGDESEEKLQSLVDRGFTLIHVVKDTDAQKTLDDQLTEFHIKYEIEEAGVKKIKVQTLKTMSESLANEAFKTSFPFAKIISIK